MEYNKQEIKQGITLHSINTNKFKTNLIAVFLTTPLSRENVTFNAILSSTLRRGNKNLNTQEEISKRLEEMYGAGFDCGLDKMIDNHVLKFYIESINDAYLPENSENILKASIDTILDMVFNPLIENDAFKEEYVNQEKESIRQRINMKIDNKAAYAKMRCVEEMYKGEPTGLFRYGYVEDLENINNKNLYEYYKKLINECKIDIFISGNLENIDYKGMINDAIESKNINERKPKFILKQIEAKKEKEEKVVTESMEVQQGKLVMGLDIVLNDEDIKDQNVRYQAKIYNSILGGSANSKLFQNVREKASLAYTASSSYVMFRSNIFINCGIEIENYEKTLEIIKKQLENMKNGDFTDDDIDNAKKNIVASTVSIEDEQDTIIIYFFGQELTGTNISISQYIENINNVTREQIINIANKVKINTIYFLRD